MFQAKYGRRSRRSEQYDKRVLGGLALTLFGAISTTSSTAAQELRASADRDSTGPGTRIEFHVSLAPSAIVVDGTLDEDAWRVAAPVPLLFEVWPGNNTAAPVETECFVTFDAANLYVGCRAEDPDPDGIRAYVSDRDDISQHDRIVFTIDPFNDTRRGFQFGISALGVQSDAVFDAHRRDANGGYDPVDIAWDAIWSSAGRITTDGYVVEAAIPFKSLRFPRTNAVQRWGFFAARVWPRSTNVEMRSMSLDRSDTCELCQANLLEGLQGITPGRNVEFIPTLSGGRTDQRTELTGAALERGNLESDFGLDSRWGITPNVTVNATINPDFSQVEADAPQFDINNRFALLFPEKRPFFLEGADFFTTPTQAFFTRSIADLELGTKLTGKVGRNGAGLLIARDEINHLVFPGNQSSTSAILDEGVTTAVVRYRRDVGNSSAVGGLYVGREGEDGYFNRTGGVDGLLTLRPSLTARFQYLHSETRYSEEVARTQAQPREVFGGDAASLQLQYSTRDWFGTFRIRSLTEGFRADAGFVPQVDLRSWSLWGHHWLWSDGASWYNNFKLSAGWWHFTNLEGRLNQKGFWAKVAYQGPLQSQLGVSPSLKTEHLGGAEHQFLRWFFDGQIQPHGNVRFGFTSEIGGILDLANSREARRFHVAPSATLRLGRKVDLRYTQSFQDVNTLEGEDIFTANISELRVVYNFSPQVFVRTIFQIRDTSRNPDVWAEPVDRSTERIFSQLLFSYKANPQTVFFLGYSDDRLGQTDASFVETNLTLIGRRVFLKVGYAWRP